MKRNAWSAWVRSSHRSLLSVTAGLVLGIGCGPNAAEKAELAEHQQEIERLRQENQDLPQLRLENQEVQRLRKENQEIAKLRGQYQELLRLRQENQQLRAQVAKLQSVTNRAR